MGEMPKTIVKILKKQYATSIKEQFSNLFPDYIIFVTLGIRSHQSKYNYKK